MPKEPADSRYSREAFVQSILCVTDFSPPSLNAFAHALMMAMNLRCDLTLFHVDKGDEFGVEWARVPLVRGVLEKWGYLEKGSPRSAVFEKVAVRVRKVEVVAENALSALRDHLKEDPVDLVVLATEGPRGVVSWLRGSLPESLIHDSRVMTLFVPAAGKGFVSLDHGGFTLQRVLVPVKHQPDPRPAITYAFRSAVFSTEELVRMAVVHVGNGDAAPQVEIPVRPYLSWETINRTGPVAQEILDAAATLDSDLIVMTTHGSHGFLGALRGSVTNQIIHSARCPVLAIPVGS
ncbi:MAG: universal stress protein [Acidobacteriia bacterium]|nr:universal stress protein [Terriglobia bacterium]